MKHLHSSNFDNKDGGDVSKYFYRQIFLFCCVFNIKAVLVLLFEYKSLNLLMDLLLNEHNMSNYTYSKKKLKFQTRSDV